MAKVSEACLGQSAASTAEACLGQSAASTASEIVVFVTRQDLYKKRAKFVL